MASELRTISTILFDPPMLPIVAGSALGCGIATGSCTGRPRTTRWPGPSIGRAFIAPKAAPRPAPYSMFFHACAASNSAPPGSNVTASLAPCAAMFTPISDRTLASREPPHWPAANVPPRPPNAVIKPPSTGLMRPAVTSGSTLVAVGTAPASVAATRVARVAAGEIARPNAVMALGAASAEPIASLPSLPSMPPREAAAAIAGVAAPNVPIARAMSGANWPTVAAMPEASS